MPSFVETLVRERKAGEWRCVVGEAVSEERAVGSRGTCSLETESVDVERADGRKGVACSKGVGGSSG
jgi:hypothetical protein